MAGGTAQRFAGRVAIVTGGSRGIGLATARQLVEEGARVVCCGRDAREGRPAVSALGDGTEARFVACDVSDEPDVERLVADCRATLGAPDVLISNAGINANFDAETMTVAEWDSVMAVDLRATWLLAKHVLPGMRARSRGSIVVVSSIHAHATLDGFFPYAAAKAGLVGLTQSLALDVGPAGVRVNCLCPGFTRTRLVQESIDRHEDPARAEAAMVAGVALGRIASAEEIAACACFLASDDASYVTGTTLVVDGGLLARRAG